MAEKEACGALNTTHLYYSDTELFSNTAKVIDEHTVEFNGSLLVGLVLNETVMHPQGGMLNCVRIDSVICPNPVYSALLAISVQVRFAFLCSLLDVELWYMTFV